MNTNYTGCSLVAVRMPRTVGCTRIFIVPDGVYLSKGDTVIVENPFGDEREDVNVVCTSNSQRVTPEMLDMVVSALPYKLSTVKAICCVTWLNIKTEEVEK